MPDFQPLPHEWMLGSIMGFFVSWLYIYGELGVNEGHAMALQWGTAFMLVFLLGFIASVVNMSEQTLQKDHLDHLAIHELRKR